MEDLEAVKMADIPPNMHPEVPPLQAMGPVPEAPVAEAWIPQELSDGTSWEDQPFLDPGKARVLFLFLDFCLENSGALQGWGWLKTPNTG